MKGGWIVKTHASTAQKISILNKIAKKLGIYRPYVIACNTRNFYKPYLYVREDLSLLKAFVLDQIKF